MTEIATTCFYQSYKMLQTGWFLNAKSPMSSLLGKIAFKNHFEIATILSIEIARCLEQFFLFMKTNQIKQKL